MNVPPNVNLEKIEEADPELPFQFSKCLNKRESYGDYLDDLAGYISASDMCSLSVSPDKCAILQETANQIRQIKLDEISSSDELQKSEVSSSKPNFFRSDSVGPLLLQALDGFLFMVNTDGKIEFVTTNVKSFLKYSQENLIDKSIYNIIHVGDHARFSSNLLPMSIGNGFGWSEPEASVGKSSFNCRFLIKPPEDQEETMEEKQTRVSQYENMQISAVLLPYGREKNENLDTDVQNHLVCVARRLPQNEKNNFTGTEQFQIRLDFRGKILSIDTSGVSAAYSQYINKDLVGRRIQDFCHHEDFPKLSQHLKETLQQGSSTSGIYRLRLAHEKIVYVQSKSKRYSHMASEQEIIIANYTLIRDSEHCLENNVVVSQRNNPSPASGNLVPTLGNAMNGNSYPFSALSPQEFNLNDIGLDFLPSSSWDLGGGEEPTPGETLVGPSASRTASAFSPDLRSPAQVSATDSPAPGRATPFSNTFPFSPQTASRTASPASRRDEAAELSNLSPMGGLAGDSASVNQKLRNLLTHGVEEADSSVPQNTSDKMEEGEVENGYVSRDNVDVSSRSDNVILRELLNQEDEDASDENRKGLPCDSNCNVNASDLCSSETLQKGTVSSNNLLRKVSADSNMTHRPKAGASSGLSNEVMSSVVKRKSPDTPTEDSMAKRQVPQNPQQAHLAGQNPMLASMLAQTPRTAPSVPTSIANAIVSQLPQERLPKNLEKKLVHTPYTSAPTASSSSGPFGYGQVGTRSLLSTSLQQEVVTADARGHVTLAASHGGSSFQGGFLHKILPQGENANSSPYGAGFSRSSQPQNLFDGMVDINSDANMGNTSDPLLSDILDQVWSMEQDMNLDSTSSDDIALFKLLEEIPETAPATSPRPPSAHDVNEKMAIHAIQRQLMSFEIPRGSPRFQQQQQQQQLMPPQSYPQANPYQAPPAYVASTLMQRTRAPVLQGGMVSSAPPMMQMGGQRQAGPQYTTVSDLTPQMRRQIMERRQQLFMVQQQKRLLLQQQKQQLSLSTRPAMHDNLPNAQSPSAGAFVENINELMNNTVAPNVSLQRSASMPEPQLSPRYSGVPSPSQQLSPPGQRPSFSPQPYYASSRLSPHSTPAWVQQQQQQQRVQQNPANLQQQNPMLNAQLSQQQASFAGQARFSTQQQAPRQVVVRSLPSPGSRNSPYSNPPDSPFHPPSPGLSLYQQQPAPQPQQQRMQRAVSIPNRVNSPRGMSFGEPLLSPQPSPGSYGGTGPGFNPSGYGSEGFSFEQQVYQPAMVDRNRSSGGGAMTSEYVRQELRAMVGARTQQHQVHQQQLVQPMTQASGSQSTNQSLSQADFEALGFSLDLPNDGPPSSPALFPHSIMGSENQSRTSSPRFQLEEQRPTEQKKSLLQQLLSEPP